MRNLVIAAAALAAISAGSAYAADLPVKAPRAAPALAYDWSGIYIGGSVGGEWGNIEHNHYSEAVAPGPFILNPSYSRATIGAQAGAQYMFSSGIVLGLEGALNNAFDAIHANQLCPSPPIVPNLSCNQGATALLTAGGRLGYAVQGWTLPVMIYATGGWAGRHLNASYSSTLTGVPLFQNFWGNSFNPGWYAGVGVEAVVLRVNPFDVVLGVEYQHFELDSRRATNQLVVNDNDNIALASKGDLVRARLSFKLNPFGSAAVVAKY